LIPIRRELKLQISEQLQQFLNGESSGVEYGPKSANTETLVIGDDDTGRWIVSTEDDVAAALALHNETNFFQGANQSATERSVGIFVMGEKR
jgi:hypothetical protein